MDLYFFSGLGADKRIFQRLKLPEGFTPYYVEWLPIVPGMNLMEYCNRLSVAVDQSRPYSFIGVSFGGIIAIELSRILRPVQTIIISSFCNKKEVPIFYRVLGSTGLFKLIPKWMVIKPNAMVYRLFGTHLRAEKELLKNILQATDQTFFKWAVDQLFSWDNTWTPENLIHFHGTADRILPYKENMHAIPVAGGEHLMVFTKAEKISELLRMHLRLSS